MHSPEGRFDPHATLRKLGEPGSVLDGLVRRIGSRWERFRRDASSEATTGLERDLRAALAQITSLRTLLEGPAPEGGEGPAFAAAGPGPPPTGSGHDPAPPPFEGKRSPTGPYEASAGDSPIAEDDLEAFLREARAGWERLLREPAPQALGRLEGEVRRLLHRAEALRRGAAEDENRNEEPDRRAADRRAADRGMRGESRQAGSPQPDHPEAEPGTPAPAGREGGSSGTPDGASFPPFRDMGTGLLTREGFDALASGELKRSRRHGRPFALLLMRPRVEEGDALRELGAGIRRALRESDFVGRYGGVVLALGLPETGAAEARAVADRLRSQLEERGGWGDEAAAALAVHPKDGETLLTLADAARTRLAGAEAGMPADGAAGRPAGETEGASERAVPRS